MIVSMVYIVDIHMKLSTTQAFYTRNKKVATWKLLKNLNSDVSTGMIIGTSFSIVK